jgi:hypothetical protein
MERIVAANVGFDLAATEAFGRDEVTSLSTCGPAAIRSTASVTAPFKRTTP